MHVGCRAYRHSAQTQANNFLKVIFMEIDKRKIKLPLELVCYVQHCCCVPIRYKLVLIGR